MTRNRGLPATAILVAMLLLAGCGTVTEPAGGSSAGTPTVQVTPATPLPGTVSATPGATGATATPGAGAPTVTLADDGRTVDLAVGQRFLLALGSNLDWTVSVADTSVLSRVVNILVVRGAQGVYVANAPGTTTLTAIGDLPCRKAKPPCAAASRGFRITVNVRPPAATPAATPAP